MFDIMSLFASLITIVNWVWTIVKKRRQIYAFIEEVVAYTLRWV